MKLIQLTKGKFTQVDDSDFEWLSQFSWHCNERNGHFYAVTQVREAGKVKRIKMHRMILGLTDPKVLGDHEDNDGLNNQRYNLRKADYSQNRVNTKKKKNKYFGVSYTKKRGYWIAAIKKDGKTHRKWRSSEREAALAYNIMAKEHFGEFAKLNIVE